jgi:hypothetical protein
MPSTTNTKTKTKAETKAETKTKTKTKTAVKPSHPHPRKGKAEANADDNKTAMLDMLAKSAAVTRCQQEKCPKESADAAQQKSDLRTATLDLVKQLQEGKLTKAQFISAVRRNLMKAYASETTFALNKCSVARCRSAVVAMLDAYERAMQGECRSDASRCAVAAKARKILRDGKDDDDSLVRKMRQIADLTMGQPTP